MKILSGYIVDDRLYQSDTGPEAVVGDQVKLYLNTEANENFPEFIVGVIQHPIVRVNCGSSTSYSIQYDEDDLEDSASLIRPGDVIDAVIVTALTALNIQFFVDDAAAAVGGFPVGAVYFDGTYTRTRLA